MAIRLVIIDKVALLSTCSGRNLGRDTVFSSGGLENSGGAPSQMAAAVSSERSRPLSSQRYVPGRFIWLPNEPGWSLRAGMLLAPPVHPPLNSVYEADHGTLGFAVARREPPVAPAGLIKDANRRSA